MDEDKNELGHKQHLLIVFGLCQIAGCKCDGENFLARFINPVRSKYKKPALFNQAYYCFMPSKMILKKTSRDNSFKSSFTKPNF
jgi:hypothetical protein